MLENPAFRPKVRVFEFLYLVSANIGQLFTTGNGPHAGQEETFPEADNDSKFRRSVENAETVGQYLL